MGRLSNSWELMKVSLRLVRAEKTILLYPLISGFISIFIVITFIGGIFYSGLFGFLFTPSAIIMYFILYFVLFFIGIYFNTAIIAFASKKLEGGQPTLSDGFKVANENLGAIIKWSLLAGTVGLILKAIEKRVGIIGKIVISFIGFGWAMATFFIIPVLINEKTPILKSIKRSANVFKDNWGETLMGNFAFSFFFIILGILGIFFIFLGIALGGLIGFLIGLILAIIFWVVIACIANAAKGILVTVLYRFALTGKIYPDYPAHLINPKGLKMEYDNAVFDSNAAKPDKIRSVELSKQNQFKRPPSSEPASGTQFNDEPVEQAHLTTEVTTATEPLTDLTESEINTIKNYMEDFDLNQERALNLYLAGYKTQNDFKDVIVEDLLIVDNINPTVARHIISKLNDK